MTMLHHVRATSSDRIRALHAANAVDDLGRPVEVLSSATSRRSNGCYLCLRTPVTLVSCRCASKGRGCAGPDAYFGKSTVSITWMTPLLAPMSVFTTFAPSTSTLPPSTAILTDWPLTVFALVSFTTSAAITSPATTW